eukprot:TRINITY_DN7034_c3_g1_i1.p1 TRINITY_DN7034_c3_g1~~TRINITY_DN7034_c3_g1_i1.p1  ORF type:complete len:789 (+),score=222.59 TRINITY_DN7034_c3_g1_i1:40-2367(+)
MAARPGQHETDVARLRAELAVRRAVRRSGSGGQCNGPAQHAASWTWTESGEWMRADAGTPPPRSLPRAGAGTPLQQPRTPLQTPLRAPATPSVSRSSIAHVARSRLRMLADRVVAPSARSLRSPSDRRGATPSPPAGVGRSTLSPERPQNASVRRPHRPLSQALLRDGATPTRSARKQHAAAAARQAADSLAEARRYLSNPPSLARVRRSASAAGGAGGADGDSGAEAGGEQQLGPAGLLALSQRCAAAEAQAQSAAMEAAKERAAKEAVAAELRAVVGAVSEMRRVPTVGVHDVLALLAASRTGAAEPPPPAPSGPPPAPPPPSESPPPPLESPPSLPPPARLVPPGTPPPAPVGLPKATLSPLRRGPVMHRRGRGPSPPPSPPSPRRPGPASSSIPASGPELAPCAARPAPVAAQPTPRAAPAAPAPSPAPPAAAPRVAAPAAAPPTAPAPHAAPSAAPAAAPAPPAAAPPDASPPAAPPAPPAATSPASVTAASPFPVATATTAPLGTPPEFGVVAHRRPPSPPPPPAPATPQPTDRPPPLPLQHPSSFTYAPAPESGPESEWSAVPSDRSGTAPAVARSGAAGDGCPGGEPRGVAEFWSGQPVMHEYRGPGVVVGTDDGAVIVSFDAGGTHTYRAHSLARGLVQPLVVGGEAAAGTPSPSRRQSDARPSPVRRGSSTGTLLPVPLQTMTGDGCGSVMVYGPDPAGHGSSVSGSAEGDRAFEEELVAVAKERRRRGSAATSRSAATPPLGFGLLMPGVEVETSLLLTVPLSL